MAKRICLRSVAAEEQAPLRALAGARWVRRFNDGGLAALEDRPRSGRPPTHDETVKGTLLSLALQKPRSLGLPFAFWTRLQVAFQEREGLHLATSMGVRRGGRPALETPTELVP